MPRTIKMKDAATQKAQYTGSALRASAAYGRGVQATTNFMERAASDAAELAWQQGVTAAAQAKLRSKGLTAKTTNASWQNDCITKGATVIGSRIQGAGDKYSAGYAATRAALEGLALPDKVPDDPLGNLQRIAGAVVKAEYNAKRAKEGLPPIA